MSRPRFSVRQKRILLGEGLMKAVHSCRPVTPKQKEEGGCLHCSPSRVLMPGSRWPLTIPRTATRTVFMKTNALSRRPTASYRPRLEVLEDRTLLAINLLSNGSFENGPALDAFRTVFAPSAEIDGWTVTRGSVDHISSYWTASDGARSLDLDGLGPGTIGQTFVTSLRRDVGHGRQS
jgi:hypothetical protein